VFSHGWPLSSDDWDAQKMQYFGEHGYRCIAHTTAAAHGTIESDVGRQTTWIPTPTT